MPFSTGTYAAPASSWNPAVANTDIDTTDWIALLADLTTALSTCVLKDGTQTATAMVPFALGIDLSAAASGQIKFPATQNASADANTLDDYRDNSFTGTATGYTTSPTTAVRYTKVGKLVTISAGDSIQATSNATTKTITGMPAAIRPSVACQVPIMISDNGGAYIMTRGAIGTDGVITIYGDITGGGWTSSGTATILGFSTSYSI